MELLNINKTSDVKNLDCELILLSDQGNIEIVNFFGFNTDHL